MSARCDSNETPVSISHSDVSHEACSRDSFDKEQYEKFPHSVYKVACSFWQAI